MVNYLTLLIAGLLVGMESRTINTSNLFELFDNAPGKLQELKEEKVSASSVANDRVNDLVNSSIPDQESVEKSRLKVEEFYRFLVSRSLTNLGKLRNAFVAKRVSVEFVKNIAPQWLWELRLLLQTLSNGAWLTERIDDRLIDAIERIKAELMPMNENIIPICANEELSGDLDELDIDALSSENNETSERPRYEDHSTSFSLNDASREENEETRSDQPSSEHLDDTLITAHKEIDLIRRYLEKLCSKHHSSASSTSHPGNSNEEESSRIFETKKVPSV